MINLRVCNMSMRCQSQTIKSNLRFNRLIQCNIFFS